VQIVRCGAVVRRGEGHSPAVCDQRLGNLRHRKHEVHRARHDGAPRHAVIAGLAGVLRDDEAAFVLHGFEPEAAVGPGSRQDHADGAPAALLRQRVQQKVERQARAVTRLGVREVQGAVGDRQVGSGRNDVKVVALDRHAIGRLPDRHRGVSGQQVHHHAFVGRIEMLDQDKGHAVAGGQRLYKLPAGIKATRRGAYSDNREVSRAAPTATRREGALARSRPRRFGRMSTASRHSYRLIAVALPSRNATLHRIWRQLKYFKHCVRQARPGAAGTDITSSTTMANSPTIRP